ncbi:MAG: LLM class flavin-dependent oxidoreductase, partial [Acidimicrobiaceae bacterium]|nr:LLM class flavin-dependent oxidoreductase [Acidimicrobiaceae bacterium]
GHRRTPELAARFADEFNAPFHVPADADRQFRRVREACSEIGRDPGSLRYSVAAVICCGVDDAELSRRAAAIGRDVDELRRNGACGKPASVAARLEEWAAVGADTVYLQFLDLSDLDHIRLVAREVAPALS